MDSNKVFQYAPLIAAGIFVMIGLVTLSYGSSGVFFLLAGCCGFGWWLTTPAAQAYRKEQAKFSAERRLEQEKIKAERKKANPQFLHQLFDQLSTNPGDRNLCSEIVRLLQVSDPFLFQVSKTREFYDRALQVLADNPDMVYLKQFCLEVGRWHCGRNRTDGRITIYDEQAIQNDINVRAK